MPFFGKAPRPGGKRKRADPAHTVQRRAGKARKERMVTHMSVKLRERPVVRKAMRTGVPQRLLPLAFQLCAALLGWLGAGAPLLGGLRPLGLCFAAAVPTPYAVCAAAGAAAGYAFALPLADAAPYLAGAAVVALLRGLAGTRRQNYAPMAPATAAGIVFCLIRSGLAVAGYAGLPGILSAAAEALLVLGLSYLLVGFFAVPRQGGMPQDAEERAALCFAFMALLACLTPYTVLGLSVARAAAALTVLAVAARGQEGAAAVTAVGAMAALCAADPANLYAGLGIAAGGLAAGLFTGSSRPVTALVFCGAGLVGVSCAPGNNAGLQLAVELCIAGAAYCLLPAGLFQRVPAAPPSAPFASRAALTTLSGRLEAVSGALCAVGDTVQAVCERLPPRRETTADLCDAVAERCCKACGKRLYCWVDCAGETYDAFNNLSPLIAMPDGVAAADLPPVLQRRCQTPVRLANAINVAAAEQAARRAARTHDGAARAALCEQYSALAAALAELAGQVYQTDVPDKRKARRLEQLFSEIGLEPLETTVAQDASGRVTATVCVPRLSFTADELKAITDEVSTLCRRTFAPAQCIHSGTVTKLLFRERPRFAVDCAVCALPAGGDISADAIQAFPDETGHFHAVLCDGMGTGKAAAVGGVLAASLAKELLHAGFESASTARLVNIALALKSDDESAVALDALSIDLYTGDAVLYKAGAAASFLLRDGKAAVYSGDTLPIGILGSVTGRRELLCLSPGDTAVLVSDGALAPGASWLRAQLVAHADDAPQKLADAVARAAREKQQDMPDDVTVMALRLRAVE